MTTALGEHELLTAIEVPAKQTGQGMAYVKFTHPASRYAVIGVAAVLTVHGRRPARGARSRSAGCVRTVRCVRRSSRRSSVRRSPGDASRRGAPRCGRDLGDDILGDIYRVGRVPEGRGVRSGSDAR